MGGNANNGTGIISASAPNGSKVLAAYLYTATFGGGGKPTNVTLDGNAITYDTTSSNATACCGLQSHRVDVTSIVKPVIDGGAGGVYDFNVAEGNDNFSTDGHALVVVYENASLPDASVGLLDGFASVTGDTTSINFSEALDPTQAGFFAEMRLGIGFSCCDVQRSTVEVNDQKLTEFAGNNDNSTEFRANGNLITVGGFDDVLLSSGVSYAADRERYDLTNFITKGDTKIKVDTINASKDDNIFLAAFYVSGKAGFNEPPDPPNGVIPLPAAGWLLGGGLLGLAALRRRAKR